MNEKMPSHFSLLITAATVGIVFFGAVWSLTVAEESGLTIRGSTTVLPIVQNAAEIFMERSPQVDISVQGGGSGVGIASIIEGTCEIAASSRSVKNKELAAAADKGVALNGTIIARDGMAVIVHPSNPVRNLSAAQLKDIYTRRLSNWSQLGGEDKKIVVVSRDVASGTFEAFNELALKNERVRPDALMQASNQAVATTVANTPGAIGYVGLGYLSTKVKAVAVDGVLPSKEAVADETYPLARPLYLYANGEPRGIVKSFIDFILSPEGTKIVEELGFVASRQQGE